MQNLPLGMLCTPPYAAYNPPALARGKPIATAVLLLHLSGLYVLQIGLLGKPAEQSMQPPTEPLMPIQILSELMVQRSAMQLPNAQVTQATQPNKPSIAPQQPPATQPNKPSALPAMTPPAARPTPLSMATAMPTPRPAAADNAQTFTPNLAPAPSAMPANLPTFAVATNATPDSASQAAQQSAASTAKLELPSSSANYLNNAQAAYPSTSRRLGEAGKVVVRVYVGSEGAAQKTELHSSSGFARLDNAALAAASSWRYAPGKRSGTPEAMWVNVPVTFTLD